MSAGIADPEFLLADSLRLKRYVMCLFMTMHQKTVFNVSLMAGMVELKLFFFSAVNITDTRSPDASISTVIAYFINENRSIRTNFFHCRVSNNLVSICMHVCNTRFHILLDLQQSLTPITKFRYEKSMTGFPGSL